MSTQPCPFCPPDPNRVFDETDSLVIGLWDAFAVTPGHALVIPRRHVATWFEASAEEQLALIRALDRAKSAVMERHRPDGFNIGVNVGAAAGQTVPHLHVHLIPRYEGDVPDPRGGVRHVIPWKANYLERTASGRTAEAPHRRPVVGSDRDPFLPHLKDDLAFAKRVDLAVAFLMESGLELLQPYLREILDRGGRVRLLTGDYLGVTEPEALLRILDLQGDIERRVFQTSPPVGFHPKTYLLYGAGDAGVAYVGSSNLSRAALERGVEWNYRVEAGRDPGAFAAVAKEFEDLFVHELTRPLDNAWVAYYAKRRQHAQPGIVGEAEPPPPWEGAPAPPKPTGVQLEALAALEASRARGDQAGLVVMATGLGKTWLAAFDAAHFERVLFVAHREEILDQAQATFRRIRPGSRFGRYTGQDRSTDADVLFASVQTLGRAAHLERFDPARFDYVVVDEFHHAAAATYRRLIDHFQPQFLLGLTATPERTDGGDLLALCDENLVYRCDLPEGIAKELLVPFHYFGVPDEVDYANIPWRSARFDEEALTQAVATQRRARNALEQWRTRGGTRTLGFCVSRRHADFMADYFKRQGVRAAAVHSGPTSSHRAESLEALGAGRLQVLFAVDVFNEGVDVPAVDTVLMLRPTESRIVWLQQLGRGLRRADGKSHLNVIDYIGNHRTFLIKAQTLFQLGDSPAELKLALDRYAAGELDLPPGCEVTYELEALDILKSLIHVPRNAEAMRVWYQDFEDRMGARPTATEAFHAGHDPRNVRTAHGSWLRFVRDMGGLTREQEQALEAAGDFLDVLHDTPMSRSYKMLVLEAMLQAGELPGAIGIEELTERFGRLARRRAVLREDVGPVLEESSQLRRHIEKNPIDAWKNGRGTRGRKYFSYRNGVFSTTALLRDVPGEAFRDLVREVADWRLAAYLDGKEAEAQGASRFVCRVSHTGGRPMLFLPSRESTPGIPSGWTEILVDGRPLRANFVKVALNVVKDPRGMENLLPGILRGWFGEEAGRPGSSDAVMFEKVDGLYRMRPHW